MKRLITSCLFAIMLAPASLAYADITQKRAEPDARAFELPSQDEIDAIKAQLPDFNAIMSDLMALSQDESFKQGMSDSLNAAKKHMDMDSFKSTDGELPDMSAMMGAMLDMLSDEAVMGGMMDQFGPMQELMEKHVPEAADNADKPDWQ